MTTPHLPDDITLDETDRFLDRVALEITSNKNGKELLPLYEWLERERDLKARQADTMSSVLARVAKR